jgi:hypothetical protein
MPLNCYDAPSTRPARPGQRRGHPLVSPTLSWAAA